MVKRFILVSGLAMAAALAAAGPAGAAVQVPAGYATAAQPAGQASGSQINPEVGYLHDYAATGYKSQCMAIDQAAHWSDFGCRNVDESIQNDAFNMAGQFNVRLFYSAGETGPHTCVPFGTDISNLNQAKYQFNSGSGTGLGQKVWNNVASSTESTSPCTAPIGTDNPSSTPLARTPARK
ncbi:MAG TPA: hypothetical protein VGG35_12750 [Streptosporangiaceae bacterium]|jgi:hypothetical protein